MEANKESGKIILFEGQKYHCVAIDSEPWNHPEVGLRVPELQAKLPNLNFTPCRWRFICTEGVIAAVPVGYFDMRKPDAIPVEIRLKTEGQLQTCPLTEEERKIYRMMRPSESEEVMPPERIIGYEYRAVFDYLAARLPNESENLLHEIMMLMKYEAIYDNGNRDYFIRVELCKVTLSETASLLRMEQARLQPAPEKTIRNGVPAEQYIFRRNRELWEIQYDSEDPVLVQHRKGFEYIRFLLANPGKEFSLSEIKAKIDPPPPSIHKAADVEKEEDKHDEMVPIFEIRDKLHKEDAVLSPGQLKKAIADIKELQAQRHAPETSVTRREELDECIQKCQDYLRKVTDKAGRSRRFNNADENYRSVVGINITNAIKNLPAELKDFARHINGCVKKGFTLKYSPASTINWLTEDM